METLCFGWSLSCDSPAQPRGQLSAHSGYWFSGGRCMQQLPLWTSASVVLTHFHLRDVRGGFIVLRRGACRGSGVNLLTPRGPRDCQPAPTRLYLSGLIMWAQAPDRWPTRHASFAIICVWWSSSFLFHNRNINYFCSDYCQLVYNYCRLRRASITFFPLISHSEQCYVVYCVVNSFTLGWCQSVAG